MRRRVRAARRDTCLRRAGRRRARRRRRRAPPWRCDRLRVRALRERRPQRGRPRAARSWRGDADRIAAAAMRCCRPTQPSPGAMRGAMPAEVRAQPPRLRHSGRARRRGASCSRRGARRRPVRTAQRRRAPGCELRERQEPERGQVGDRLVECQTRSSSPTVSSSSESSSSWWSVPSASADEPCVGQLVPGRASTKATENVFTGRHVARHQCDDEARVEPSAQHRAERDVAHQPHPHGFFERARGVAPPTRLRRRLVRGLRQRIAPVRSYRPPPSADDELDAPAAASTPP